jgi:hypothetical protein
MDPRNSGPLSALSVVALTLCFACTLIAERNDGWEIHLVGNALTGRMAGVAAIGNGDVFVVFADPDAAGNYSVRRLRKDDGTTTWSASLPSERTADYQRQARVLSDGAGNAVVLAESTPYQIVKYDGVTGQQIWNRTIPNDGRETPIDIAIDGADNVVAMARSNRRYLTVKFRGTDGEVIWERAFSADRYWGEEPTDLLILPGDDVVVTGRSGDIKGNWVYATHRYRSLDGSVVWSSTISGDDGTPLLASNGQGDLYLTAVRDYVTWLGRISGADGTVLWQRVIEPIIWPGATAITSDASGDVVVVGQSWNGVEGWESNNNVYTIKCSGTDGSTMWEAVYDFGTEEMPHAVSIDNLGHVVVAATGGLLYSYENATGVALLRLEGYERHLLGGLHLLKYEGLSGSVIWRKTADFDEKHECLRRAGPVFAALVLRSDGDPAVMWTTHQCSITAKYAGDAAIAPSGDGSLLGFVWEGGSLVDPAYTTYLKSRVYSNGDTTKVWLDYGETSRYGERTRAVTVPARWTPVDVAQQTETQLSRGTYHFRVVTENSQGLTFGPDRTFKVGN